MAWTCTLRVASSTTELTAVIRPVNGVFAPSAVTRTSPPTRSRPTSCCGTVKFTKIGSSDCSGTTGSPPARYWPRFTCRIPSIPANGARMVLRSMVARISPTLASACFCSAEARS